MRRSMTGWAMTCVLLGVAGCTFERYDDCETHRDESNDDDDDDDGFGAGATAHGGKANVAGAGAGGSAAGGAATGATANGGTATGTPEPQPPRSCAEERDCDPGYNCDGETQLCTPSEQETCGELDSETACSNRRDCEPVYGGLNCSCGADCECQGGEPGCVCESFDFFVCRELI